jgi:hypothetical protein
VKKFSDELQTIKQERQSFRGAPNVVIFAISSGKPPRCSLVQ